MSSPSTVPVQSCPGGTINAEYNEKRKHEEVGRSGSVDDESLSLDTDLDEEESIGRDHHALHQDKRGPGVPPQNILQRVLSVRSTGRSTRSYPDPGPPPDGGLQAWLQVFQGHLCLCNAMGYSSSYSLFLAHYLTPSSGFPQNISSSTWAWPGALQMFFFCFLGSLTGRLFDAGYYRQVLCVGFTLQLVGIFTTAQGTQYWHILLSQGIIQGMGNGCMLAPSVSLISTYFSKNRAFAIACLASGTATGGVVFPLIAQHLLPKIGFSWTVRVMGFVMLANMAISLSLAKTRIPPRRTGPWVEWSAFTEPAYVLFVGGMFCVFLGLYFAFSFVRSPILIASTPFLIPRSFSFP